MKGMCCYRSPIARVGRDRGDANARVQGELLRDGESSQDRRYGVIKPISIDRFDKEEQASFRFTVPQEDGEIANGDATIQIGPGRYNCDGTYSFYGDKAAPPGTNFKDAGRWELDDTPAKVDLSKPGGQQVTAVWATNANKDLSYLPYIDAMATALAKAAGLGDRDAGFNILSWTKVEDASRLHRQPSGLSRWTPSGEEFVAPLERTTRAVISVLGNITRRRGLRLARSATRRTWPAFNPH